MTPDERAELRDLRRRAYAPDGDIAHDEVALARLAELEAAAQPVVRDATVSAASAHVPPTEAAPEAVVLEAEAPEKSDEAAPALRRDRSRARSRPRRRLVVVWAATLVAALVVGAAATWGSVRLVSRAAGVDQVAVLEADPAFVMPPSMGGLDGQETVGYRDFYGLTAITGPGAWLGGVSDADSCLILMRTDDATRDSVSWSTLGYGCGVGEFAATAQFRVDLRSPEALRERFADGTPLQFVFDGERIGVYAGDPPEPEQPPRTDT